MKKIVTFSFIAVVMLLFVNCAGSPSDAIIGKWELIKQDCNDKGDHCKNAEVTVMQEFKKDGKCIRYVSATGPTISPSLFVYKVKDKAVKMNLYENESVIKEFDIMDYSRNQMLIRWKNYTECDLYKRI